MDSVSIFLVPPVSLGDLGMRLREAGIAFTFDKATSHRNATFAVTLLIAATDNDRAAEVLKDFRA